MGSDFITEMIVQSYCRSILVSKMIMKHESVFDRVEFMFLDHGVSEIPDISHLDDVVLYRGSAEELPIFFRAARNFTKRRLRQLFSTHLHFAPA